MLRFFAVLGLLISGTNAFAQMGVGESRMSAPSNTGSGMAVSALYTSLSEYESKTENKGGGTSVSKGGPRANMAGARLSYFFDSPGSALAFDPGLSMQKSLNKETENGDMSLTVADINLIVKGSAGLNVYFGPSYSKFETAGGLYESQAMLGGQIGFGYKTSNLNLRAGYVRHGIRFAEDDFTTEGHAGGFSTQIGYVF